jgi:predicted transcriptional regulator
MFGMAKTVSIKIDKDLHVRLTKIADVAGYATVDEFVAHVLEKEMVHFDDSKNDDEIRAKLKGLGYIS